MRYGLTTLALIVGAYAFICALAYVFQGKLVWFPERRLAATPSAAGLAFEDVHFRTTDGIDLHGWYVAAASARWVVLFCHGNAGNISHRLDTLRLLHHMGVSVLIFDYRGYGRSEGSPSEAGTYADVDAAYAFLVEHRGIEPERIVVFGRSLGAAIALRAASRRPVAGLVVESGFPSIPEVGSRAYPWLPVRWMSRIRYDARGHVGRLRMPKLVLHSPGDEIVPIDLGRRLYDMMPPPKQFVETRGDHNSGFIATGDAYESVLHQFFASLKNQ